MSRQAIFDYFLSDDRKQDTTTTDEHIKRIIRLLQNRTVLFSEMSNMWENTDGCAEQFFCTTALYLLSMLAYEYKIIIDRGVGAPGHGREVVDGLNATKKAFF